MALDCDDLFGEIPDNFHLLLEVEGASAQDVELGLAQARQILKWIGVDPRAAFRASQIAGLMYSDLVESGPSKKDLEPWHEWARLADMWNFATEAAVVKASSHLTPGEVVVCSFILDWPNRVDKLGTCYAFPHMVGESFGMGQTYSESLADLMDSFNNKPH
jgi:hypothetical protein